MSVARNFPALAAALVQAVLAIAVSSFGLHLTTRQAGVIEAAAAAAAGLVVALAVHERWTAALAGVVTAVVMVLVTFKVPGISVGLASTINGILALLAGFFTHTNVSPAAPAATAGSSGQGGMPAS